MFARFYMRLAGLAERLGAAEHRTRLLAGLTGQVIEVGAGHGPNFRHYPSTVREVLAVEPEDTLRAHAQQAAENAPVTVKVVAGSPIRNDHVHHPCRYFTRPASLLMYG